MPKLKLTYFDAPGRAESVRIALALADLPFEDRRLKFPEFAALKAEGVFPLGSVPVLEVDGLTLTQTGAMLRYVARLGAPDLYPADALKALIVDSALDTFNDTLSNALLPSMYERDVDRKLALRAEFAAGPLVKACAYVEGLIARSGGPFLLGATLSIADIVVALQIRQVQSGNLDGLGPEALEPYPRLVALAEACFAEPRVAAYHAR